MPDETCDKLRNRQALRLRAVLLRALPVLMLLLAGSLLLPMRLAESATRPTAPPAASSDTSKLTVGCGLAWRVVNSPNSNNYLTGVEAISANDVWASGYSWDGTQTVIEHWDGLQWSVVASPNFSNTNRLYGISAASANDIWTVGWGNSRLITMHWDGSSWSNAASVGGARHTYLYDVAAISPNDAWAVGEWFPGEEPNRIPIILRWNGTQWNFVYPDILVRGLKAVTAISANDVWFVGGSGEQGLTAHYDGSQWTNVPAPVPDPYHDEFNAVDASSTNNVWAVGWHGWASPNQHLHTLIEHWDGSAWNISPAPDIGELFGVAAISANDVWAVGSSLLHWDGTQWSVTPIPGGGTLKAISAVSAEDIWAVGSGPSQALVLHYSDPCATATTTPTNTPVPPTETPTPTNTPTATSTACGPAWRTVFSPNPGATYNVLHGVTAVSANDIWAVGYHNIQDFQPLTEHWDGTQWSVIPNPNLVNDEGFLLAVEAVSANDVWAVGTYCSPTSCYTLVEHWDGSNWNIVPSPNIGAATNVLYGVSAVSANDVWAVGYYSGSDQTLALHYDGAQWSVVPSPNVNGWPNYLTGVDAVAANDVWAVGYYGFISGDLISHALVLHWDGSAWTIAPIDEVPNGDSLHAISALASNDIWAVGSYHVGRGFIGLAVHWDGTTWTRHVIQPTTGSRLGFYGVTAIAPNDIWAVGTRNYHWDGGAWTEFPATPGGFSQGVAAIASNDVWAVGTASSNSQTLVQHYSDPCATPTATPTNNPIPTSTPVADAFMELVPEGNAPPNGGTVNVGDRFVLGLWLNSGSHNNVTAHQSYLTFTWQLLRNVNALASNCVATNTITADLTTLEVVLQNEVCNDFTDGCTLRSFRGEMAYTSATQNPSGFGGSFRVAQIGLCALAPGQALLHWQFSPPDPPIRDTHIVDANGNDIQDRALFTDYIINIAGPTNTATVTLTGTPTRTHTVTPTNTAIRDAFLELVPEGNAPSNGGTVNVGDRFVLGLWLNAGSHPDATGQQSYITFTHELIKNARVSEITTTCILTNTVRPDTTTFDAVLQNVVCNGPILCYPRNPIYPGMMAYASGAFENPPAGGSFRVAQIGLCALAPGQALLHWQFWPPDPPTHDTQIVEADGNLIQNPALFTDYIINIVNPTPTSTPAPGLLTGHVTWQGRPPQPDPLQQLPITLTLKMGALEYDYSATTDPNGNFTVDVSGLLQGTYNWRVKGTKHLANSGIVTLGGQTMPDSIVHQVEMGLMRAGDSNNDNVVDLNDYTILQRSFGRAIGATRYDDRAEFTGNGIVSLLDYNPMKVNFGQSGAPPISP